MFFIAMAISCVLPGQETNANTYIEGGKVILEFVKLFKGNSENKSKAAQDDCKKTGISDIFFENKRTGNVRVVFTDKKNPTARQEVIVQPGRAEGILRTSATVYICEIIDMATMVVIRKGDIVLTPCENPTIEIE